MAYQTYNGTKLFSYDDSVDEKHRQYLQQKQAQQQQKSSNPIESFFSWIGDTAGAIGNTVKDTVGAIASPFVTATQETKRTDTEKSNKQKLDNIAKKYGFNSYNEISDDAWNNNKEMIAELQQATKENTDTLSKQGEDYKNNWAVKNTANVKQNEYGANAIKTWNTLADVLTAPASMPLSMAVNAGQGVLSGIGDQLQETGEGQNFDWGNALKRGGINALAGVAGGAAGAGLGKAGSKLLGSNNKLAKGLGRLSNTGIARGAASGAAGGATGAGLGTAFEGGNLEQILANAAAGAQQGAGTGAVMGGAMSLGNKAVNKAKTGIETAIQNSRFQKAISQPDSLKEPLYLGELSQKTIDDIQNAYRNAGIDLDQNPEAISAIKVEGNSLYLTPEDANHYYDSKISRDNLAAKDVRKVMRNSTGKNSVVSPEITSDNRATIGALNKNGKTDISHLYISDDNRLQLRTSYPSNGGKMANQIKNTLGSSVLPSTTTTSGDSLPARTSALQGANPSIAQDVTDVNSNINNLERPTGWNGDELSIKKGNVLNRAGNALEQTGENIRNKDINNRLYSKTAEGVYERDSINTLRKLGYEPENYKEAAKVSETVNKFTNDVIPDNLKVKNTNIQNTLTDFEDVPGAINNAKLEDNITKQIIKRIDGARTSAGGTMDEYDVKNLWKGSKELMDLSTSYRKKGMSVNGDVTNPDYVTAADRLSAAAKNMRSIADNEVQWGDSFDKNVLTNRLKNLGASQNDIDYLTQAKDLADLKRRTSVYEDARQMDREIGKSNIRRNAVAGTSTNPVNILTQESGIGEILRTAARPVGKATGAITRKAGQLLNKAGDIASNIGEPVSRVASAATNAATTDSNFPYALVGRLSGTEEASQAMANPDTYAQPATNLEAQLGNTALSAEGNGYTAPSYGTGTYANTGYAGTGNNMLDRLVGGMENALNAGDISAFSQLADIYNTLSKVYGVTTSGSSTGSQKLSATQQRANAAMNSLQRLSGMTPDVGYNLSGIPIIGDLATLGGNAYEGEAKSLAQQIGYMVSGSNIKAEEAEAIGKAYVPQPFDSEYTRQLKLQRAAEIIQQYQNGTADDTANIAYAY